MQDIILFQQKCGVWDAMGVRPPLGLLSIATVPVAKGYKVTLIDQRINNNWKEELKEEILTGAKIVCLTTMVGEQIRNMLEISKFIKSLNKNILVVLGGSWAQTCPELCMQDINVDVVCYGEGDYLLTELMEYCQGKKDLGKINGIIYRTKEGIKKNEPIQPIQNLDDLPKIPYHLINLNDYNPIGYNPKNQSISMTLSRGCHFRCSFCSISVLYNRTWRSYSVKRIMKDLAFLEENYGIKDFFFMDDHLAENITFFKDLVRALAESNERYSWGTAGIRADSVLKLDEETMNNLVKSGCKNLDIGMESGNERILKLIKKDTTKERLREANKKLSKYPIIVKCTFMGGFPTETEEEFLDTIKFRKIIENENPNAVTPVFCYTPFPSTELYELALKEGFIPPKNLEGWADFNYNTWYKLYPSWLTKSKIRLIENVVFVSYFSHKKLSYKYSNKLMNSLFRLYYPLAKFRYNNNWYGFMIEKRMADFIYMIDKKLNVFNKIQK